MLLPLSGAASASPPRPVYGPPPRFRGREGIEAYIDRSRRMAVRVAYELLIGGCNPHP